MHSSFTSALLLTFISAAAAVPAARNAYSEPRGAYFLSNEARNEVIAMHVGSDGSLTEGSRAWTGGHGEAGFNTMTNGSAGPDSLFSQGPLAVVDDYLFAVNAGSNTLTMMKIDSNDRTKLTRMGSPMDTMGDFPNTVAVSPRNKQVCVANTGAQAGVSCATYCSTGLKKFDALRTLDLGQENPPLNSGNLVSTVLFNEDESALITIVRGAKPYVTTYPVANGLVGTQGTQSFPKGTKAPFGSQIIPGTGNQIWTSDPNFGGVVLEFDDSGAAAVSEKVKVKSNVASCWATVSSVTGTGFLGDAGKDHLVEVDFQTGKPVRNFVSSDGNPGFTDLIAAGSWVFALSPGAMDVETAVTVFDITGKRISEVQNFTPGNLLIGRPAGMVVSY